MRKWYSDVNMQNTIQIEERAARHTGTSETEFISMQNMGLPLQNPYAQQQRNESEEYMLMKGGFHPETSPRSRTTSVRSRSNTNGSAGRPSRVPIPEAGLSVHTHQLSSGSMSPGDRSGGSYFSPITDTSSSARSSAQSPAFGRKGSTPGNLVEDSNIRYTAPALTRGMSRDGTMNTHTFFHQGAPPGPLNGGGGGGGGGGRLLQQRPSLPPVQTHHSATNGQGLARMRSASSPDIHNHARYHAAHTHAVDNVPVPPIPPHMANMMAPVRSHSPTTTTNNLPLRSAAGSPGLYDQRHMPYTYFREPQYFADHHHHYQQQQQQQQRFHKAGGMMSPTSELPISPLGNQEVLGGADSTGGGALQMPTQLKARVQIDDNYVTLVIASNILYRTLTDRVDAKLARFTDRSIGNKTVRLRYRDEDGDFVTIDSDEAVQLAFLEWREQHRDMLAKGLVGEIQLYCQAVEG